MKPVDYEDTVQRIRNAGITGEFTEKQVQDLFPEINSNSVGGRLRAATALGYLAKCGQGKGNRVVYSIPEQLPTRNTALTVTKPNSLIEVKFPDLNRLSIERLVTLKRELDVLEPQVSEMKRAVVQELERIRNLAEEVLTDPEP